MIEGSITCTDEDSELTEGSITCTDEDRELIEGSIKAVQMRTVS